MDWGAGHLTIIVGTGSGAFANKYCPQGRAFEQCFQIPGLTGVSAAGIDSHIISAKKKNVSERRDKAYLRNEL